MKQKGKKEKRHKKNKILGCFLVFSPKKKKEGEKNIETKSKSILNLPAPVQPWQW